MTERGDGDFHDQDIPSQAELDAEDMAELAKRSSHDRDRAGLYPVRNTNPGPVPVPLAKHAVACFWAAASAGAICLIYGFLNLGTIQDLLYARLLDGVRNDPGNAAPEDKISGMSSTFPPVMLVLIAVFLAVEYLLLVNTAKHNSRGMRNVYLSVVVVNMMCIPIGIDLLFAYQRLSVVIVVIGWAQLVLLAFSALCTLRKEVNDWLPAPNKVRPGSGFGRR
ncbi:hypothetical protein [Gordonia sp. (in: high G+C Gram-positive bacteria)]|jgi:hypothetical protein|uniref:hypothetical protein n=1 Tax=Gordonia sp. (in: high G+C Gram-positive bacteria) TaxID=84139 RepID=UPI001D7A8F05|nr:hypothetical protein [Gordonia sp. (in: high G+C Gram-positive bacteria)]MCB1294443.1 hypothetical protein [Gordonia sp. (in: high G+C Gram-positive bacteria)]HMS77711.1 hypothetical protein [Gordonia sp. (in: high G+C Gram-positive bacteria)]HQV18944.1 hypothetical protein [Gordonia sp. (in: high G+C Gram-positive bacteria)]